MIVVISETSQCDYRVDDRRKDCANAIALFEVLDHPLFAGFQSLLARRRPLFALQELQSEVGGIEYCSPETAACRHVDGIVEKQLSDVFILRYRTVRLAGPHHRYRDDDTARPRRHLV